MDLASTMRIIELEEELKRVRAQLTMHYNGMVDISVMLEEDDIDAARAKLASFICHPDDTEEET